MKAVDIMEVLAYQLNADYYIRGLLNHLEEQESDKLLKEHREALEAEIAARNAYIQWRNEMCVKYGNGKAVKLSAIPLEEFTKGVALEKAVKEATELEQKLDKKIDKILKI